jgi:hypothetical protein
MSKENESGNLYTGIHRLLLTEQYAEAERVLDEHLSSEPSSGEAVLSWTELKLVQGQPQTAIKRLRLLTNDFPRNPYYLLATAEIIMQEAYVTPRGVTDLLDGVAECAGDSADVLAKIGFAAVVRGFWSYGMPYFIKAMKAREKLRVRSSQDLILLWKKNEPSLDAYLRSLTGLDGRGLNGDSLDDVPLEMLVRTVCILLLATTESGISEAWPVAVRVACNHRELSEAWSKENLLPLFSKFCFNWMGMETTGGGRVGPWSAN